MPRKKALRGLSGIKVFELLENTETNYKVGKSISIPYAQSLTRDIQTSNDPIYADDEIYDDEEIFDGEDFELQIPEADLSLFPVLEGGEYDEETKEYSWGPDDAGKDYAMTFKAKRKDNQYRMFRYYKAKFKKVKQDLQTQDNGTQVSVLTISGTFYKRALLANPKVRTYKDSENAEDLKWLDTIPSIPEVEPEPEIQEVKVSTPVEKTELLGKQVEDLQENINISDNGDVTGTLKYINSYESFNKGAKGNFLALYFEEAKNGEDVMCELKGTGAIVKKPKAVDKSDGLMVFNVHNKDNTIEVTCEGKTTRVLNLSGLTLTQES